MKKLYFIILIVVVKTNSCFSWGRMGHELVAQIAMSSVTKPVLDSVNTYLNGMSWEKAAVWMDEIRSDHEYDFMKPMHYINIEKDKTYVKVNNVNIVNEMELVIAELKSRNKLSKEDINKDLKILFHLVGDIHMPLHVGYAEDKGGNTVMVDFFGKSFNLHRVWDTEILERNEKSTAEITEQSKKLTKTEIKDRQKTDITAWIEEGRALLPGVYGFNNNTITEEYASKNITVIEKQILSAGLRLSGILNEIFKN